MNKCVFVTRRRRAGHILQEQGGGLKKFEAIKTHADSVGSFEARDPRKTKNFIVKASPASRSPAFNRQSEDV